MNQLAFLFAACFAFSLSGCGGSGKPASNADKIVGTWILSKVGGEEKPKDKPEKTVEFTKDGKSRASGEKDETAYKIEGDKLILTETHDGKDRNKTLTIKTLTGDTLILFDEEEKRELELKKK